MLILRSSAAPSSWMTVTLCPLARANAAASSLTPGVAPWLVRMMSSAAVAAPCGIDARAPTMHAAANFAHAPMASSWSVGRAVLPPRCRWDVTLLAGLTLGSIDMSTPHSAGSDTRPATILESALRYDRVPLLVLLVLLPLVSWIWIVVMARDMYGPMTGASAWMMTATWDVAASAAALGDVGGDDGWHDAAVRLADAAAVRRRRATIRDGNRPARQIYALAAGYLMVWALFSVGATALQRCLPGSCSCRR